MRIVADEDILFLDSAFAACGELIKRPGRAICNADLRKADALLIRSITQVNAELLKKSTVRFVATATSGVDHIDQIYLRERGIAFAEAKGSNANAVVEYCMAALAKLAKEDRLDLESCNVAVIGAGCVGGLIARKLTRLGIKCLACDPLLTAEQQRALRDDGVELVSLEDALRARVISLHVPLTTEGEHPTFHLLNAQRLSRLPAGTIIINASRGAVLDNSAVLHCLRSEQDLKVILDVWESEPVPLPGLVSQTTLATPHLAGYSLEAKFKATEQIFAQFCEFFAIETPGVATKLPPLGNVGDLRLNASDDWFCSSLLMAALDLNRISASFKQLATEQLAARFDEIRKAQSQRREFAAYTVARQGLSPRQLQALEVHGFSLH